MVMENKHEHKQGECYENSDSVRIGSGRMYSGSGRNTSVVVRNVNDT